jgi:hypothetical protein
MPHMRRYLEFVHFLTFTKENTAGEYVRCTVSAFNKSLLQEHFNFERTLALYYFQRFIQILV